jgi:carboxypeptidase family protein
MSVWSALIMAATLAAGQSETGELTIDVVDQSGSVLSSVEIAVVGPVMRQTKADDEGRASFRDLPPGSYRIAAGLLESVSESREVTIRPGSTTALKIEFRLGWSTDPTSGKRVRHTMIVRCANPAARSVDAAWGDAEAVAHVRIDRATVYDHWQLREDAFPIVTLHDAQVLEVLKPHARLPNGATGLSIVHEAGTIERPDLIEKSSAPEADLHADREYVLFLRWSDRWQAWSVDECDLEAFETGANGQLLTTLRSMRAPATP